jgi:nickel-dependent lactate racemase
MIAVDRQTLLAEVSSVIEKMSFVLAPKALDEGIEVNAGVRNALMSPMGCPSLTDLVSPNSRVLLLADDMTRPTPRKLLIPPILDELNEAGVPDSQITTLIALGTHRAMSPEEILKAFGEEVVGRVEVINHNFRDVSRLVQVGHTKTGSPIIINRAVAEADFVLGIGSIVPHSEAGWSGGAKILQPGVCGEETIGWMHMLAARQPDILALAGLEDNPVRLEIEEVALQAGLRFIVNVVFDSGGKVASIVAGDPVIAHRAGVPFAKDIFVRPIAKRADVVVVDARPADIDYWQGMKPLVYATRAVKQGGTIVLCGEFPDGISPIYGAEFREHGRKSRRALAAEERKGLLKECVCTEALYLHSAITERVNVICVSDDMSVEDQEALGFQPSGAVRDALTMVLRENGEAAAVGIILQGGDVLPTVIEEGKEHGNEEISGRDGL